LEIYTYLSVFIHHLPRKRIPVKHYLKIKDCFTVDVGRNRQVLMEKMDKIKKALCEVGYGYKLVLDDLECN